MKPVARVLPLLGLAALSLHCTADSVVAPTPAPSLNLSGRDGNPDCLIPAKDRGKKDDPVALICTIEIPGNPITSAAKSWVDQVTGTYYLAHASNAGVEIIDIATHTWVGRVTGFAGAAGTGGGTATSNGPGPSSMTEGLPGQLWVSDGNSMLRLVDPRSGAIVASVSTAIAACDGGTETTHYCGRTNEIGYDPVHQIVVVSNPSPLALADPHGPLDGYLTFISALPPYPVLGHLSFGPGTVEGHIWAPPLNRFLLPMQNPPGAPFIAVINAETMQEERSCILSAVSRREARPVGEWIPPTMLRALPGILLALLLAATDSPAAGGRPAVQDGTADQLTTIGEVKEDIDAEAIRAAVRSLPERQRDVIEGLKFRDESVRDVATTHYRVNFSWDDAFEDIDEDNGPLFYYPGSHKWPSFQSEHLGISHKRIDQDYAQYPRYVELWRQLAQHQRLEKKIFKAKKGQALITLTTCAELFHTDDRLIAFGILVDVVER